MGSSLDLNQSSTKLLPMKPAPPVTRMVMQVSCLKERHEGRRVGSNSADAVDPASPGHWRPPP